MTDERSSLLRDVDDEELAEVKLDPAPNGATKRAGRSSVRYEHSTTADPFLVPVLVRVIEGTGVFRILPKRFS